MIETWDSDAKKQLYISLLANFIAIVAVFVIAKLWKRI